jgi:hypothetical protein
MASIDLTKLQPGKTYNVMVRAKDDNGNYSPNSIVYQFTTPLTNSDGSQLTSINSAVVTALAQNSGSVVGGALTAGGLDKNGIKYAGKAQLADIWNGTASVISQLTGSANTGAVIINSTGILGYKFATTSSGQAQFFLNTVDGNAYFRGTIYAGAGLIGGWAIGASDLTAGTGTNAVGMNTTGYPFYAGNTNPALAQFSVTSAGLLNATNASISGSISATSGSIGGFSIRSNALTATNISLDSANGFALGSASQFRVTQTGALTATSASITGNINATSGSFSGNITAQSGTFTGAVQVQSGGSLYAGTNAGSGQRVILDSTGLFGYDGNGIQMFSIPTATGASPTIARFQVLTTGIASEGSGSTNFIIGNSGSAASATANNITLNGQLGQMYSVINGIQTASSTGSGFYVDKAGNFRLAGASGAISMSNGNLSVTGNINATSGSFTGAVSIGSSSGLFDIKIGHVADQNVSLSIANGTGSAIGYSPYGLNGIYGNSQFYLIPGYFGIYGGATNLSIFNTKTINPSSASNFTEDSGAIKLSSAYYFGASALSSNVVTSDYYTVSQYYQVPVYQGTTYLYQSASDTWTAGPKLISGNLPFATSTGYFAAPTTSISDGSFVDATIPFPSGRFSVAPVVTATWATGTTTPFSRNIEISIPATLVTASGCTIRFHNYSGTAFSFVANVYYAIHAVQMTASAYSYGTMQ